jgi:AcrR family transcriptional regulator
MTASALRDVVREFRREQVITTAIKVFGRNGTLDASLEEIAAKAKVSRSTIYNHFSDRGELVAACAEWALRRLFAAMDAAIAAHESPEAILSGFFEAAFTCLDENPGFYRLTTSSLGASVSAAKPLAQAQVVARAEGRTHIERLVRQLDAASNGGIDVDPAQYIIGLVLVGALDRRSAEAQPAPAARAAAELAGTLLHGLLRPRRKRTK